MKLRDIAGNFKGNLGLRVKKNGVLIEEWADHNMIVNLGRNRMAELLNGSSVAYVTHIGVGSGSVAEDIDDTTLSGLVLIPVKATNISAKTAHFDFFIDTGTANGLAIREFGLFCGDGVMFSRRVRTGTIEKANDIEIEGYWEIHF